MINILDTEVVAPLKSLSNFWRSLDLSFINCKIELDLSWSTFRNINILFVFNINTYYMPFVEIKDLTALIANKPLCYQPVKNKP